VVSELVRRLVELSVLDGGAGSDPIARWHAAAEAAVVEAAPAWTPLRPGRFMPNALQWTAQLSSGDEVAIPFADRRAPSIDPADLAEIAAQDLTTDEHTGMPYELSGPDSPTPTQELALLGQLLDRDLRVRPPPPEAARAGMERHGFPPDVVDAIMRRTLDDDRARTCSRRRRRCRAGRRGRSGRGRGRTRRRSGEAGYPGPAHVSTATQAAAAR
jgi:uncharacterized protein YbjT (DUF2867 family)